MLALRAALRERSRFVRLSLWGVAADDDRSPCIALARSGFAGCWYLSRDMIPPF